jgi:predicted nucleic acid-binding protein
VPLILIDDADGRLEAERHALTTTGTLGTLEAAAIHGLIDLPVALTRLQATTFRARPELYQDLLARDAARKRPM